MAILRAHRPRGLLPPSGFPLLGRGEPRDVPPGRNVVGAHPWPPRADDRAPPAAPTLEDLTGKVFSRAPLARVSWPRSPSRGPSPSGSTPQLRGGSHLLRRLGTLLRILEPAWIGMGRGLRRH